MRLIGIANKLQAEGFGVVGQTIFCEMMPAAVKRGLLVTAQMPIGRNVYVGEMRTGSFQIISRQLDDHEYEDPTVILDSVIAAMSGQGIIIDDMNFRFIRPRTDPFVFPKSDGNIVEASVNFDILFTV